MTGTAGEIDLDQYGDYGYYFFTSEVQRIDRSSMRYWIGAKGEQIALLFML